MDNLDKNNPENLYSPHSLAGQSRLAQLLSSLMLLLPTTKEGADLRLQAAAAAQNLHASIASQLIKKSTAPKIPRVGKYILQTELGKRYCLDGATALATVLKRQKQSIYNQLSKSSPATFTLHGVGMAGRGEEVTVDVWRVAAEDAEQLEFTSVEEVMAVLYPKLEKAPMPESPKERRLRLEGPDAVIGKPKPKPKVVEDPRWRVDPNYRPSTNRHEQARDRLADKTLPAGRMKPGEFKRGKKKDASGDM